MEVRSAEPEGACSARPGVSSTRMLSRKKTKNEVSKPAEVQGKYVKKETSPLLRSECLEGRTHRTWAGGSRACGCSRSVRKAPKVSFCLMCCVFESPTESFD